MNALARHTPPFEVRLDFLAVGDPGGRVPRDAPREERAEQSLTPDDRQVEVDFAAAPRLHKNRLAQPLSCGNRWKGVQAAVDDVNHVVATPVSPQPGVDATAPPQEGVDVPSAQIRGRAQEKAPYLNGPLALLRGRSPCETRRKQRHGGSAPGERLRQPSCLLCGAAEALGKIRRQDHDDSRSDRCRGDRWPSCR